MKNTSLLCVYVSKNKSLEYTKVGIFIQMRDDSKYQKNHGRDMKSKGDMCQFLFTCFTLALDLYLKS